MRLDMAEKETICVALELSGGGHVYLKSTWETTSFSIVVLDGVHAWSRTVTTKEVVGIATSWKIDVGEFMNSARSHLCRQHPTSAYFIIAEEDSGSVQLSFTIDDLWEGEDGKETLDFELRLTRMSDVGAVVRETLDHLLASKGKLEAQLADAERQFQKKKLAADREPEPSITLRLARPNATPARRQSSLVEPRILDFTKLSRSEETRSVCTRAPTRADTATTSRPLEPVSNFKSHEKVRNVDDVTVRKREAYSGFDIPLSPNIQRVLNNLSAAGRSVPGEDERGVRITQMRSTASRQPTTGTIFEASAQPKDVAMNWIASLSEKDKVPENLEKSSSNAGGPGTLNELAAGGEPKEVSDEEPTSRVTLEDAHLNASDLGLRAKSHGRRSDEGRSTEEEQPHEKLESREPVKNEAPEETRSMKDIISGVSSKKSLVKDTPECRRSGRKRTAEPDRDGDFTLGSVKREFEDPSYEKPTSGSGPRPRRNAKVKYDLQELYPEEIASEYTNRDTFQTPDAPRINTVAEILKRIPVAAREGRGSRGPGRPPKQPSPVEDSPRETRLRRRLSRTSSEEPGHVLDPEDTNFVVPDPDYYNFDEERTEDFILPNQIWAVYDEKDGFPRVWARINKVSRNPKFEASITWLTPHKPSVEADHWFQMTGYAVSCGEFEHGSEGVLDSINTFSHRMEFGWVAKEVVTIYPKKGEVWALYTSRMVRSASATPSSGAKRPQFRVVHILEDVEPEKPPMFAMLERIRGFRTVYRANDEPGSADSRCLVLFSHRVPAHQLQGNEGPSAAALKGSWDVDPAGLPTVEGEL